MNEDHKSRILLALNAYLETLVDTRSCADEESCEPGEIDALIAEIDATNATIEAVAAL